jgi:tetratricopeptide (TPR) repeat protein
LPQPPEPETNPKTENARQIKLGKQAFSAREYGRAERRFQQAVTVLPDDPQAYFLLAQAQYAMGKYQEAVAAIDQGMRLQPDWPGAPFHPRDLYGVNLGDFHDHLKRLADALGRYPDDPFSAFLYAYQLWFDGRRLEAQSYFQRARAVAPNPRLSERFLQALPVVPIIIW